MSDQDANELKPCQMCGGSPVMVDDQGGHFLRCSSCGIEACWSETEDDARESWSLWIGHEGFNMPMPTELKPCPLCGSSNISTEPCETFIGSDEWYTQFTCGECSMTFVGDGDLEEARAAWNKRPDEDRLTAAIAARDAMRKALKGLLDAIVPHIRCEVEYVEGMAVGMGPPADKFSEDMFHPVVAANLVLSRAPQQELVLAMKESDHD